MKMYCLRWVKNVCGNSSSSGRHTHFQILSFQSVLSEDVYGKEKERDQTRRHVKLKKFSLISREINKITGHIVMTHDVHTRRTRARLKEFDIISISQMKETLSGHSNSPSNCNLTNLYTYLRRNFSRDFFPLNFHV
jgi:hypothetical protein